MKELVLVLCAAFALAGGAIVPAPLSALGARETRGEGLPPVPGAGSQPVESYGYEPPAVATKRHAMVEGLRREGIRSAEVLEALQAVPRHLFVPEVAASAAYEDIPLPIGYGQTISAPYVVAYMTALLAPRPGMKVLEVGTGSGYQAAVLAAMIGRLYSIEIVPELAREASSRLSRLGFGGVRVRQGDGYYGWPEEAPFDAMIVTAAADHLPPPLLKQLAIGGRMVIPLGPRHTVQTLLLVTKRADGTFERRPLLPVRFVPMTGRVQEAD